MSEEENTYGQKYLWDKDDIDNELGLSAIDHFNSPFFSKDKKKKKKNTYSVKRYTDDSYVSNSYFRNFNLFDKKRREIIKPYLYYFEESKLGDIHSDIITDIAVEKRFKVPDKRLPQSFLNDLYNLYFLDSADKVISVGEQDNKYKILSSLFNYLHGTITQHNPTYSKVYFKHIVKAIYEKIPEDDIDDINKSYSDQSGDSDGDSDGDDPSGGTQAGTGNGIDDKLKNILNQALSAAQKEVDQVKKDEKSGIFRSKLEGLPIYTFPYDTLDTQFGKNIKTSSAMSIKQCLDYVFMQSKDGQLKSFYKTIDDDFLEAEHLEELFDLQFLSPQFKKMLLSEIYTETTYRTGKVCVYMDISTSMTQSRLYGTKKFTLALMELNMLDSAYVFNDYVYKIGTDVNIIKNCNKSGGTDFNAVYKNIVEDKNSTQSIILTDGQCSLPPYNPKCIFVAVEGGTFSGNVEQYAKNNKLYHLDVGNGGFCITKHKHVPRSY